MTRNLKTNIFQSILWSVSAKWSARFIGLIGTMVLARILTPADFGILAMAAVIVAFLDSITQAGLNLFVLRIKENDERLFNSTWTIGLIQAFFIAASAILAAPWIAKFYNQPVLIDVIYCLALVRIIQGLNNFGILLAQKNLNFKFDFLLTLYTRLIYFFVTLGFAFYLKSFWALIIGQLVSSIFGCLLSYLLHSYRPKLSLYRWKEIFKYSKSTIPLSIGRYVNNQADIIVVGRVASAEFLGIYHIAINLAGLFTKELFIPVIRGLVPNLSTLRDSDNFKSSLTVTYTTAVYLFLPIGFGLAYVAQEFVLIILGDKWLLAIPMLKWFSLYCMVSGLLMFFSEQILVIVEKESLSNKLMWFRNSILICTIIFTLSYFDVTMLPKTLFFSVVIILPLIIYKMCRALELSILDLLKNWWPSFVATLFMVVSLSSISFPETTIYALLLLKVLTGALTYLMTLVTLFLVRGQPQNSFEGLVLSRFRRLIIGK